MLFGMSLINSFTHIQENWKFVIICVQNQWGVVHPWHGTVANLWGRHKDFTEFNEKFEKSYLLNGLSNIVKIFSLVSKNILHIFFWVQCSFKAYIAHSSGRSLMNLNLPFKSILRWFEVVFWCLQWECCAFEKDWWKFIQIRKYYTMALITKLLLSSFPLFLLNIFLCLSLFPVMQNFTTLSTHETICDLKMCNINFNKIKCE